MSFPLRQRLIVNQARHLPATCGSAWPLRRAERTKTAARNPHKGGEQTGIFASTRPGIAHPCHLCGVVAGGGGEDPGVPSRF